MRRIEPKRLQLFDEDLHSHAGLFNDAFECARFERLRASRQKMPPTRTPGHAMKVSEDAKARFAVLGQALTGLTEGRGWVQVLVGKQ